MVRCAVIVQHGILARFYTTSARSSRSSLLPNSRYTPAEPILPYNAILEMIDAN